MARIEIKVYADDGSETHAAVIGVHPVDAIRPLGDGDGWMWIPPHDSRASRNAQEDVLTHAGWGLVLANRVSPI